MREHAVVIGMIALAVGTGCGSSDSEDRVFTCTPSDETVPNAACPDEERFCWSDGRCHATPGTGPAMDSGTPPPPGGDAATPPPPPPPLPPGADGRCDLATCDLRTQMGLECCPAGQQCYSRYDVPEGLCSRIVGAWTAGLSCSGPGPEGFELSNICQVGAACTGNPNGEERPPAARLPFCRTICDSDADCGAGRCMQFLAENMQPFPFGVCSIPCDAPCLFGCFPITVTLFGTSTRVEVEQCASMQ